MITDTCEDFLNAGKSLKGTGLLRFATMDLAT